jgi:hypothetical protein
VNKSVEDLEPGLLVVRVDNAECDRKRAWRQRNSGSGKLSRDRGKGTKRREIDLRCELDGSEAGFALGDKDCEGRSEWDLRHGEADSCEFLVSDRRTEGADHKFEPGNPKPVNVKVDLPEMIRGLRMTEGSFASVAQAKQPRAIGLDGDRRAG